MNRLSRRAVMSMMVAAVTLVADVATADGVPLTLQAQLVAKLAAFDRNFASRAGASAQILVLYKTNDAESERVANNIARALSSLGDVGGVAARVQCEAYSTASALAARCRTQKLAIIYFSTSLESEMPQVATELAGQDVLTVGGTAPLANRGVVVAFDLEEGKPKVVVNITRAKAQNVAFKADLLRLARIIT